MKTNILFGCFALIISTAFSSCNAPTTGESQGLDSAKIVSTNGTLSEILVALGMESHIVGVDVASTYPPSLQEKPKIGHNRDISAEGVLALGPNLVLGINEVIRPEVADQIRASGVKLSL